MNATFFMGQKLDRAETTVVHAADGFQQGAFLLGGVSAVHDLRVYACVCVRESTRDKMVRETAQTERERGRDVCVCVCQK